MVTKSDVVGGGQAVRVRGGEADGPAVVHRARRAAGVAVAGAAVDHHGVLRGTEGEGVGRLADEGELGVSVGDPMYHLLGGHDVRCRLRGSPISRGRGERDRFLGIPRLQRQSQFHLRRAIGTLAEVYGKDRQCYSL